MFGVLHVANISYTKDGVLYEGTSNGYSTPSNGILYEEYGVYFDAASNTITGYDGKTEKVTIPSYIDDEAVLYVASSAFKNALKLEEIVLPNTVKTINDFAFIGCINLKNVVLSEGLTNLGDEAFANCKSLEEITLPAELNSGDGTWFIGCYNLKKVTISSGATAIPAYAFQNGTSIEEIVLPNSIKTIGNFAFSGCDNLKNITLPENLTTLGYGAFSGCISLETMTLPPELSGSFGYSSYPTKYGNWFSGCYNLKKVTVANGATTIPAYAFQNATSIEEIVLPKSIKTIGNFAFGGCDSLKHITLSDNLTQLGYGAFGGCISLESIVLPAELSASGGYSSHPTEYGNWFNGCYNLKTITIENGATTIPPYAFQNATSVEKIILPNSVKTIGKFAFGGCDNLKYITLSENLTSLGYSAFGGCISLEAIVLPPELNTSGGHDSYPTKYGNWFNGCYKLDKVVLSKGITNIPDSSFLNAHFTNIYIPESIKTIRESAFSNNYKLKNVYYGGTKTQWNSITINDYNTFLLDANINYNSASGIAKTTGILIDLDLVKLNIGNEYAISYNVTPSFANDKEVTWTSTNPTVAEVKNGIVYAKAVGNATVTVKTNDGNYTADFVVNVYDGNAYVIKADNLELNKQKVNIVVGGFDMVSAKINPINTTYRSLKWSSSNENVAIVEDGVIFAKSAGKATITAETSCGATASCEVNVSEDSSSVAVTGITLNKSVLSIEEDKSETLIANITPSDATNKAIIWTSSDNNVATVSGGKITAVASGTATITAKTVNGGYTASCVVTVVPKVEITAFTAANYGANAFINLSVVNAPADAVVYVASYDTLGKLLELQKLTLNNGSSSAIFSTSSVFNYKAFIWKGDTIRPLSDPKECKLQ